MKNDVHLETSRWNTAEAHDEAWPTTEDVAEEDDLWRKKCIIWTLADETPLKLTMKLYPQLHVLQKNMETAEFHDEAVPTTESFAEVDDM